MADARGADFVVSLPKKAFDNIHGCFEYQFLRMSLYKCDVGPGVNSPLRQAMKQGTKLADSMKKPV